MIYLVTILLLLVIVIYKWQKTKLEYWKRRGITYVKPLPFLGNYKPVLFIEQSMDNLWKEIHENHPNEQVVGFYQGLRPVLLVKDPDLLKYIFVKDFPNFQTRNTQFTHTFVDDNLFAAEEEKWRILRQKLTPLFTSGKLKGMIPLIKHSIDRFMNHVDKIVDNNDNHELRSLIAKYTLEVIGSCAFGVEIDALNDNAQVFEKIGEIIFRPTLTVRRWMIIDLLMPQLLNFLHKFNYQPHVDKRTLAFFTTLTEKLLNEREGKPKVRQDFMDLMIELKEQGRIARRDDDKTIDLEMDKLLIAAQSFIFYAAGFETSSSTMSFMLFELANHPDVQDRAYEEIIKVSENYDGKITYDSIKELQYLTMCFDETLRKYPVVNFLERVSANNYTFPGTNITIEKGTKIVASPIALHHDETYFSNPHEFDPERFTPENKILIPHCAYLPFGEGPRNCIGMRFAKVSSLLMLSNFLKKFKVTPLKGFGKEIKFSKRNLTLATEGGLMVNITRR